MHFILKNHVSELADEYELTSYQEPKLFEFFCNFCVVSKHYLGRFNPVDVTTAEDDASLDGIAIVIDGELITKIDDAIEIFETHRPNLAVDLIFTQAKSGESFKKSDIANFSQGLQDFLSLEPKFPNGKFNLECLEILKTIFSSPNLRKVKNRRPNIHVYYSTSGTYRAEAEISASFDILKSAVTDMGYFHSVLVNPMGRTELLNLYAHLTQTNEASLKVIDYFGMPQMPGIPQSYVAIVNASCLVDSLLTDKDDNLMPSVFEENVRSFLGSDNDVNSKIKETLSSESKRSLSDCLTHLILL